MKNIEIVQVSKIYSTCNNCGTKIEFDVSNKTKIEFIKSKTKGTLKCPLCDEDFSPCFSSLLQSIETYNSSITELKTCVNKTHFTIN